MKYLIAFILVQLMFLLISDSREPVDSVVSYDTITYTKIDTVILTKSYPVPFPVKEVKIDTVRITDTVAQLSDYTSLKIYQRNLDLGKFGLVKLTDSLQMNRLKGYTFTSDLRAFSDTKIITVTKTSPVKNKVFIGAVMQSDLKHISVNPTISFLNKQEHLYQIMYDPLTGTGGVGISFKIRLKK